MTGTLINQALAALSGVRLAASHIGAAIEYVMRSGLADTTGLDDLAGNLRQAAAMQLVEAADGLIATAARLQLLARTLAPGLDEDRHDEEQP